MSETVTLSIDGKDLTVPKGTSVIEATEMLGIDIPRFCWHPGLSVAGVCRFCLVKIEGLPKLQIACNTQCSEGMKVITQSDEVKEAHKWALEFHLINHPLDCPICDQAGECELQNYYMKVGKYTSQMEENKILKPKALDVGDNLVLDTERCILCSRCVRFEDEVTKTSSLGIFNRGDHAIIGTFPGKKVQHNYSYNLVDICPVGAFTAKDFRFKCRVWFLKEMKTICPGCSTGCNVSLFHNRTDRKYYRLKPLKNNEVNGFWMCDLGRTMYTHLNEENRLSSPLKSGKALGWQHLSKEINHSIASAKQAGKDKVAVVLTPQYTNEEYEIILKSFKNNLGFLPKVFIWRDSKEKKEDFDGILLRGDRNPNTKGMHQVLENHGIESIIISKEMSSLKEFQPKITYVFGPEIESSYAEFEQDLATLNDLSHVVYFGNTLSKSAHMFSLVVPTKVFSEKRGHFVNHKGISQKLTPNMPVFPELLDIETVLGAI